LSMWSNLPPNTMAAAAAVAGAHTALAEEHVAFGILNSDQLIDSLANYRLLILPEQSILTARECDAIRTFVDRGGALIATGDTGTRDEFALADLLGVKYLGRAEARRCYLRDSMDVQVNGAYSRVELATAKMLLPLVRSAAKQSPADK